MIYPQPAFVFYVAFALLIYLFLANKFKTLWLIICSFLWYASWEIEWAILLFCILSINYFLIKINSQKSEDGQGRGYLYLVLMNSLIFLVLKSEAIGNFKFVTPYGSSFYLFIIIAFIIDHWRSPKKEPIESWQKFFLLPSFFPMLMGGPIERRKHFINQMNNLKNPSPSEIVDGILIFSWGFLKYYFLTGSLKQFDKIIFMELSQGPLYLILLGISGTMMIYIDFSSYTDMGRGVARCFGIKLSVQFRPFYYSKNPNDFWERWNITLGTWIRDYISFPMLLRFGRKINHSLILIFSFLLMGLWHGLTMNRLYFGLFNGIMIVCYNLLNRKFNVRWSGRIFAFVLIVGNGILQRDFSTFNFSPSLIESVNYNKNILMTNSGLSFWFMLMLLLLVEFLQERKKKLDWFLEMPAQMKALITLSLIACFIYALDKGEMMERFEALPFYFKI